MGRPWFAALFCLASVLCVSVAGQCQLGAAVALATQSGPTSVRITEIEVNGPGDDSSPDTVDWVEICNTGTAPVAIGGWVVEAEVDSWSQWGGLRRSDPVPLGTILEPGECTVIERSDRWMTNDTTKSVKLFAEMPLDAGGRVMMLVDEAMCRYPRENPYDHFIDNENNTRTFQLVDVDGYWWWLFREQTRGTWSLGSGD